MLTALGARVVSLAVALVGAMFFLVCQSHPLGSAIGALSLAALLVGPAFTLERTSQVGLSFVALVVGVLMPRVFAVEHPAAMFLTDRTLLIACPALLIAITRGFVKAPTGGAPVTVGIAIVALAACGRAPSGLYGPIVVAAAAVALLGLFVSDPGRAWPSKVRFGDIGKLALALGVASIFGLAVTRSLPALHDEIIERITGRLEQRTGFSTSMELTALDGMFRSDEVVVRVRGGDPPLLRGAIFSRYVKGFWADPTNGANRTVHETPTTPPDGGGYVELEFPRRPERYFMPAKATDVRASLGQFHETPDGIRSPVSELYAKRVWYKTGEVHPLGPRADDLFVEASLLPQISGFADDFAKGSSELERLDSIQSRLQHDYKYALEFDRTPDVDPVVDFLRTHKSGHCEYFASAMVLLARASGIHARLVTGFRVIEGSRLGGYRIVRERNAHAWVEAWVDGHWMTFDPTPPGTFDGDDAGATPFGAALVDLASTSWEKVDDFLAVRTPFELSFALVGLVGLLLVVRWARGVGPKRAKEATSYEPPLTSFVALEAALGKQGHVRAPNETLVAFADRVAGAGSSGAELGAASRAIRRYAELRYGGGEEAPVVRELSRATQGLRERARA